jgi:hypothetical protein
MHAESDVQMKKWLLTAWPVLFVLPSQAQLLDQFSDGEFSSNPPWLGLTDLFVVENEMLRLSDPDPSSANVAWLYVAAPTSSQEETVWEWYVRLDFDPSSSNYARIYLQAALPGLPHPEQQGYYIRVGGVSGAVDALELYRQDGAAHTLLLAGTPGAVASQPAQARFRVVRSAGGLWTLWADYTGGTDYQLEGSAADSADFQADYAGLVCYYSATRNDDFYFDDVRIDPLYADLAPPVLLSAQADGPEQVRVFFDEKLEEASATDTARYWLWPDIGRPREAVWADTTPDQVVLALPQLLQNGVSYSLQTSGLLDEKGNESGPDTTTFTYLEGLPGQPYDLLITEIMADPSPAVGLPEAEYLELYNRSGSVIQLEGWTLSDGGSPAVFPLFYLPPQQFLLVCAPAGTASLSGYGPVVGLPGFPGLNNSGDRLVLRNASGSLIHQVAYSVDWYGGGSKDEGGWSLELVNPSAPCVTGGENWRASEHPLGGTPGQANSVWEPVEDQTGPLLRSVYPLSPGSGKAFFDKALSGSLLSPAQFAISGGVQVIYAGISEDDPQVVELEWAPALAPGIIYQLTASGALADCDGNAAGVAVAVDFGLPSRPAAGDVVINEILFQPEVGGAEFVELFNRSEKVIDLSDLLLGNLLSDSEPITAKQLLLPGAYAAISPNPSDLAARYASARSGLVVGNDLPALPDDGGTVVLYAEGEPGMAEIIDSAGYDPAWRHSLLGDTRGVSLERIDPYGESAAASNWHSASASAGYATPGAENSQQFRLPAQEKKISLPYDVFSPDGDGEQDFLLLSYELDGNGYTASVTIFDALGRQVKELARNELLATSGSFKWNGDDHNGARARMGIYVIWIRLLHPGGEVWEEKHVCVLAGRS